MEKKNNSSKSWLIILIGLVLFVSLAIAQPIVVDDSQPHYQDKERAYAYVEFASLFCTGATSLLVDIVSHQKEDNTEKTIPWRSILIALGMTSVGLVGVILNTMIVGF